MISAMQTVNCPYILVDFRLQGSQMLQRSVIARMDAPPSRVFSEKGGLHDKPDLDGGFVLYD